MRTFTPVFLAFAPLFAAGQAFNPSCELSVAIAEKRPSSDVAGSVSLASCKAMKLAGETIDEGELK